MLGILFARLIKETTNVADVSPIVFNTSGSYNPRYGKHKLSITGKAQDGTPSNYVSGNYVAGNYVSGNAYYTYVPGSYVSGSAYYTYVPGNYVAGSPMFYISPGNYVAGTSYYNYVPATTTYTVYIYGVYATGTINSTGYNQTNGNVFTYISGAAYSANTGAFTGTGATYASGYLYSGYAPTYGASVWIPWTAYFSGDSHSNIYFSTPANSYQATYQAGFFYYTIANVNSATKDAASITSVYTPASWTWAGSNAGYTNNATVTYNGISPSYVNAGYTTYAGTNPGYTNAGATVYAGTNPGYSNTAYTNPGYSNPSTTGAGYTFDGVYIPGGAGTTAPILGPTFIPDYAFGTSTSITIPSGGYLTISFSV